MENFGDTFNGRLLLLIIDKIVIGAIVAIAFFFFDKHKTKDARKHQARQAEVQLQFERSRLIKEFLPVIQDDSMDLVTRGYVLRSAVLTRSLDADAAFEIGQDFLRAGLSENHYKRIVSATLPDSVAAFARRGVQIENEWHGAMGTFPELDTTFNPVGCGSSSSGGPTSLLRPRRGRRQLDPSVRGRGEEATTGTGVQRYLCRQRPLWGFSAVTRALRGRSQYASKHRLPVAA